MNNNTSLNVFISHSSDDKYLIHSVINILGKNGIIVDEYVFEDGERTEDEINLAIENSGIFCLLISQSSMDKEWVKKEITKFKDIIDSGKECKFLPLIIDEKINYSYPKIPNWIRSEYNLRNIYSHPIFIARKIAEELNKLKWEQYPQIRERELIFAGRDYDIAKLREKYASSNFQKRRAVIVSGIPDGIGRRRFLIEFIRRIYQNKKETYQPLSIALDKDNSVEDFIIRLNSLLLIEGNESIISFVAESSRSEKILKAIKIVKFICERKEVLLIRDNGAIVQNNGEISDWFEEIISSTEINQTVFFIASRNRFVNETEYSEIVSYALEPLSERSAIVLMKELLQLREKSIPDDDLNFFIEKTAHMPQLIFNCVDKIVECGVQIAKLQQKSYEYKGDDLIKSIVEDFKDDTSYLQMLILLSEIDFLTYQQIKKICHNIIDNVDYILMKFFSLSIYEHFGTNNEFIRMNPVISDLVKRARYRLDPSIWSRLQDRTNEIIEEEDFETADLGILSKKIEKEIKGDIRNINRKHIVPSIALRIIVDEYSQKEAENYRNVITLCIKMLENSTNLFSDILQRIYYYLCASYAQLGENTFLEYCNELSLYEGYFLRGIYNRKHKQYVEAEKNFRKALKEFPFSYTAKNELAISLQRQGKYQEALKYAKEVYQAQPINAFYIVTYFKSLVRDPNTKDEQLKELINKLDSTWDTNLTIFKYILQAEYEFFRNKNFEDSIYYFKKALSIKVFRPILISASEICNLAGQKEVIKIIEKEFRTKIQ